MGLFAFNRMRRAQQEAGNPPAAPVSVPQNAAAPDAKAAKPAARAPRPAQKDA